MEYCPYCEEDSALDANAVCRRCERRNAALVTAAFYAREDRPREATADHFRVARDVLRDARDFPRDLVEWAQAVLPHPAASGSG